MSSNLLDTPPSKFSRSIFLVGWVLIAIFSGVIVFDAASDIKTSEATGDTISLSAITASERQINLFWSAPSNAATIVYTIYRDEAQIHRASLTNYQDDGLVQNTTYSYMVTAYDPVANEYWQSSASATTEFSNIQVSILSYIVTSKSTNSAVINWETNIPSTGIVSYSTSLSNLTNKKTDADLSTKHSVTITGLKSDTRYYYRIKALGGTTSAQTRLSQFRTQK